MREFTDIVYPETIDILKKPKGFITDIKCPECEGHLVVREGYAKFLGCSNFPKCRCKIGIPRATRQSLHNVRREMFSDGNYYNESYEETMSESYPSGINCKDDM